MSHVHNKTALLFFAAVDIELSLPMKFIPLGRSVLILEVHTCMLSTAMKTA